MHPIRVMECIMSNAHHHMAHGATNNIPNYTITCYMCVFTRERNVSAYLHYNGTCVNSYEYNNSIPQ